MNTILFDLDGTLLPIDMELFMKIYFDEMGAAFRSMIDPKELIHYIWSATGDMVKNTENKTNEEVFIESFSAQINGDVDLFMKKFDEFYDTGFLKVKEAVADMPIIKKSVDLLRQKGYELILATNPLFPQKAIHHRIRWAGFEPKDFMYITSYENNHYCKPQIQYYEEVLKHIGKKAEECMMVGNDVQEDLIAGKLGMNTFLIKDYILHRTDDEIDATYQGTYEDFYQFVQQLPMVNE